MVVIRGVSQPTSQGKSDLHGLGDECKKQNSNNNNNNRKPQRRVQVSRSAPDLSNLCSPVVGAVPEHLAGYVEAFKDVERGDNSQARMWGWGRHHAVAYRRPAPPDTAAAEKHKTTAVSRPYRSRAC